MSSIKFRLGWVVLSELMGFKKSLLVIFLFCAGCSAHSVQDEKLPSSYADLVKVAGKYTATKDASGKIVSETFENNRAANKLCLSAEELDEIWVYCSPFIYEGLANVPEYSAAKNKYNSRILPPDPGLRLIIATKLSDLDLMRSAIEAGADVNKSWAASAIYRRGDGGVTPLEVAFIKRSPRAIKLLLDSGAMISGSPGLRDHSFMMSRGDSKRAAESLDLLLGHGFNISPKQVSEIHELSSRLCDGSYRHDVCGLKEILQKYPEPRLMWQAAEVEQAEKDLNYLNRKAKDYFEKAGLYYIPVSEQDSIKRKKGMKVCLTDGEVGAAGYIEDIAGDKVKILVSELYPKHLTSIRYEGLKITSGAALWAGSSDWMVCEKP